MTDLPDLPARLPTPQDCCMPPRSRHKTSINFSHFSSHDAAGVMLAHSLTVGDHRFRKGHLLTAEDVMRLQVAGITGVSGARLTSNELAENPAAEQIATRLSGPNTVIRAASGGRCNLHAVKPGIVVVDADRIIRTNLVDESVAVGTLPPWTLVQKGQVIATVKIIPCGVNRETIDACHEILATPAMHVAELHPRRVALIITELPGLREKTLAATISVTRQRLEMLGSHLALELHCHHEPAAIESAVRQAYVAGCEMILISGAAGTKDRRDLVPSAIVAAGGRIGRFGMPVEPGNMLLLAWLGDVPIPVLVLPGCARSRRLNGLDWVLQRLLADLPLTDTDFAAMGVGGLIRQKAGALTEPAAETLTPDGELTSPTSPTVAKGTQNLPRIAALVLAAGQSSRMSGTHKLLEKLDGIPLVKRAVNAALASQATSVIVVTGNAADEIEALITGPRVTVIHNPNFIQGMATSLRRGIEVLPKDCEGVLVLLADMPHIHAGHLDKLIEAYTRQACIILPMHNGRRGNPVLWPRQYFLEMMQLTGDQGARNLLERHATEIVGIEIDDGAIFIDIDTPQDLADCITGHFVPTPTLP